MCAHFNQVKKRKQYSGVIVVNLSLEKFLNNRSVKSKLNGYEYHLVRIEYARMDMKDSRHHFPSLGAKHNLYQLETEIIDENEKFMRLDFL